VATLSRTTLRTVPHSDRRSVSSLPILPTNSVPLEAEPSAPRLITTDPTIEALIKGLCHDLPSMGLFCDEGGQFRQQHHESGQPFESGHDLVVTLGR
jgi:hypothetical protein